MTRNEFYDKYGDVEVEFSKYYKYTFTYRGLISNDLSISVGYGGESSEIYRTEIVPHIKLKVIEVYPYTGTVTNRHTGEVVDEFYDF